MFGRPITLFKMFGFSVRVDLSWLVIMALVTWSLASGVFPSQAKLTAQAYLLMGLAGAVGLFVSIVLHELCHSLVARQYGMTMKGITLFIFGGVAEMTDEPPSPKAEFWMAIAGPIASVVLAAAFWVVSILLSAVSAAKAVVLVFSWLATINVILAAFNLVPGFPLDGGRVLRAILWGWKHSLSRATELASKVGRGIGTALIVLGFIELLLGEPMGGLWWILIGMFIRAAARQGYQQVLIRQMLAGEPVSHFMNPNPVTVPPETSLEELVDNYVYRYHFKMFPVVDGSRLVGCVSTAEIKNIDPNQWPTYTVSQIVHPCGPENTIAPGAEAVSALAKMSQQTSKLMVVSDGRLEGILTLKDLMKFLSLKLELESREVKNGTAHGLGHSNPP